MCRQYEWPEREEPLGHQPHALGSAALSSAGLDPDRSASDDARGDGGHLTLEACDAGPGAGCSSRAGAGSLGQHAWVAQMDAVTCTPAPPLWAGDQFRLMEMQVPVAGAGQDVKQHPPPDDQGNPGAHSLPGSSSIKLELLPARQVSLGM